MSSTRLHNGGVAQGSARALSWLRARIAEGAWRSGDRLPTLEALAASAGVARLTMWRAVSALKAEGVLTTRRGSGIFLGATTADLEGTAAWMNIAAQLTDAIYRGAFRQGSELPAQAKLQLQFGANYRTVHKALSALVRRKLLVRNGVGYGVPSSHSPAATFEVVLLTEGIPANDRSRLMLALSDQLAIGLGVKLARTTYNLSDPPSAMALQDAVSNTMAIGFMIEYWGLNSPQRARNWDFLLQSLYATGRPIAIVDSVGDLDLAEPLRSSRRVCHLTIAARIAGEDVGRHLHSLRHRTVAFLTLRANEPWSQRRYAGLRQASDDAGIGAHNVRLYTTESYPANVAAIACAAANLSVHETAVLFPEYSSEELAGFSAQVAQTIPMLHEKRAEHDRIRKLMLTILSLFKTKENRAAVAPIRDELFMQISGTILRHALQPMFQKLVRDTAVTAWVAATDGTAIAARDFLKSCSIPVPTKISVCGFDNSQQATLENISSYDFDAAGIFSRGLSFAAGKIDTKQSRERIMEWPGAFIARGSTGKRSEP